MKKSKILQSFARNVRALRVEKGWSQEELGKRADLHRTYIGSIERHWSVCYRYKSGNMGRSVFVGQVVICKTGLRMVECGNSLF